MKVTIEVDTNTIMESIGKAIEAGAIDHWGSGDFVPAYNDAKAWVAIDERLAGRTHTVKHRLGERALQRGLATRRCAGLPALERGDAPATVVDTLVQTCLFGEVLYPMPERATE